MVILRMHFKIFQIAVPVLFIVYTIYQISMVRRHEKKLADIVIPLLIFLLLAAVSIFPEATTKRLARLMGVQDNVNGLLVFLIGVLLLLVNNLYEKIRTQNATITKLAIHVGLKEERKENEQG